MKRIYILLVLLGTPACAQSEVQCEQVRQAVRQYGYHAARAYAERTISPEQVRGGEACLHRSRQVPTSVRQHQR